MIYSSISPDSTVNTSALVAGGASNILNRTNTLYRYDYGELFRYDYESGDGPHLQMGLCPCFTMNK